MIHYLCNDIFLKIYSFVGHNSLYLDKSYFNFLKKMREKFVNNPIKLGYIIVSWKYPKSLGIIHKSLCKMRPNMKIIDEGSIYIQSNISIGNIVKNNNLLMNNEYEVIPSDTLKKIILGDLIGLNIKSNYINTNVISYDIIGLYSDNINYVKEYNKLWVKD